MLRKVCAASLHAASPLSFSSTLPDRCCSLWRCLCPTAGLPSRGHRHTVAFFLCVFITVTLVDQGSGGTHSAFGLHLHDFLVDSCDEDTRKSISVSLSSRENMELTSRANGNSLICISSKIWSQSAVYFEPAVGVRCWEEGKRFPSVSLSQIPVQTDGCFHCLCCVLVVTGREPLFPRRSVFTLLLDHFLLGCVPVMY